MENQNQNNDQQAKEMAEIEAFLANKSEDEMLTMFVQQILIDKGYVHLDVETRKKFIAEMKEQLTNYINEAIVAALPDDKLEELDRSLDAGTATPETINQLVENSGVDVSNVVQQTMLDFREAYLGPSVTV